MTDPVDFDKKDAVVAVTEADASDLRGQVHVATHEINERALLRKIDWHLVPVLSLLYLLSFLDRTNVGISYLTQSLADCSLKIGNARLFGLEADLKLRGMQYPACLAIFFVFYILFEVPSNMVMKAWRPSRWLPIIMLGWGVVITLTGIVHNFTGLFVVRVFLGITEAGLFPGVSFYLTMWYRRNEVNFRISLFFSAATAAGAFGGLLARVISLMHGQGGLAGWRWIFIIEGIATVVVAVASFWWLYDYPNTARFLSEVERVLVTQRLQDDSVCLSNQFKKKFVFDAFLDWKIWALAFMNLGSMMSVYAFALFSPTLIAGLGYKATTAQLLSAPPYVLAALTTVAAGWGSDRTGQRGLFILGSSSIGIVGFLMCAASARPAVGYAGVFIGAAGIYPLVPLVISWAACTIGGTLKRSVGIAMVVSVGNIGGIISSFIYRAQDRPRYLVGHCTVIGFITMIFVLALTLRTALRRKNAEKQVMLEERGSVQYSKEEMRAFEDDGDSAPFFFYTL